MMRDLLARQEQVLKTFERRDQAAREKSGGAALCLYSLFGRVKKIFSLCRTYHVDVD